MMQNLGHLEEKSKSTKVLIDGDMSVKSLFRHISTVQKLGLSAQRVETLASILMDNGIDSISALRHIHAQNSILLQYMGIPDDILVFISHAMEHGFIAYINTHEQQDEVQQSQTYSQHYPQKYDICSICKDPFATGPQTMNETCLHIFCTKCVQLYLCESIQQKGLGVIPCPRIQCSLRIADAQIRALVDQQMFNLYLDNGLSAYVQRDERTVRCPNASCAQLMSVDPSPLVNASQPLDYSGTRLSERAWIHFNRFRVRCRYCTIDFCMECLVIPYHKGYDCEGWSNYCKGAKCRFCHCSIEGNNVGLHCSKFRSLDNVCDSSECVTRAKSSCTQIRECGHVCNGLRDETVHLGCLQCEHAVEPEDFCCICYVEGLGDAPCLIAECGHVFHAHCAYGKVKAGYSGARISFKFKCCPLDGKRLQHPFLTQVLSETDEMEQHVVSLALARLRGEGRESEAGQVSLQKFALGLYLFFLCFKCKEPYFAGGYQCQEASAADFDESELVCPSCQPKAKGLEDCTTHGRDWIAFKCRFCCELASWYCWGNTHFCDNCHHSGTWQSLVEYRSGKNRKKIQDYTQCSGLMRGIERVLENLGSDQKNIADCEEMKEICSLGECKLGIRHPPNGIEFGIGCTLCADSNDKSDQKHSDEIVEKRNREMSKLWRDVLLKDCVVEQGSEDVLYWLGSIGRTQEWVNPGKTELISVKTSSLARGSDKSSELVGIEPCAFQTNVQLDSYVELSFHSSIKLGKLSGYSICSHRSLDSMFPRSWRLEYKSENSDQWKLLRNHIQDCSLSSPGSEQFWPLISNGDHTRISSIRIIQRGLNSGLTNSLCLGRIRLYGHVQIN